MVPAPPFCEHCGDMGLGAGEDLEMGEAAQQVFGEAEVAAAVLDAGDDLRIALAQAADDGRREGDAGDIREMIEIEPEIVAPDAIDDGGVEPEDAVLADAAAKEAGRHQQHAVDALRRRVDGERHHVRTAPARRRRRCSRDGAMPAASRPSRASWRSSTANSAPSPVVPKSVMPSQPAAISMTATLDEQARVGPAGRGRSASRRRRSARCFWAGRSPAEPPVVGAFRHLAQRDCRLSTIGP